MKKKLLILFLFISSVCAAQELERVVIDGKINVPQVDELYGITIFNSGSNQGTISNEKGEFDIAVAVGDTLVFSAVQFENLVVVVDQAIKDASILEVTVSIGMNQLPEVVVKSHDLSGNLSSDLEKIPVEEFDVLNLTFAEISSVDFEPDAQSEVQNAAIPNQMSGGINVLSILGTAVDLVISVLPAKKSRKNEYYNIKDVNEMLRNKFDENFFIENLGLQANNIAQFLYFVEDFGLSSQLLEAGKELDLIQFLMVQAKKFKLQME